MMSPRYFKRLALTLLILAAVVPLSSEVATARGGGGFGGGRGGFGGGGGMRGFDDGMRPGFDRGFGGDGRGFGGDRVGDGNERPGGMLDQHTPVSESDLRDGANQNYNWSHLPGDVGMMRSAPGGLGDHHITTPVSNAALADRAGAVARGFRHWDAFDRDWWGRYPNSWWCSGWGDGWPWAYSGWDDLYPWWGVDSTAPVAYDYGDNISYQGDDVYYGSQPYESAGAYYSQAQTLASSATPTATEKTKKASDWKSLGVFVLTQGDQTDTNSMFQLAVNKSGVVRGNYFNPLTQDEKPVQGKIDLKTKRVAWTVGTNKDTVYDTGLANLLAGHSTLLLHVGKSQTQQWNIFRLDQPKA